VISFIIPTNGKKNKLTNLTIESIFDTVGNNCEIILTGDVSNFQSIKKSNVLLYDLADMAKNGYVGYLRNFGVKLSNYNIIAFVDDDVIFPKDWYKNFLEYNKNNTWNFLTNKIFLPSGGRYWDRFILDDNVHTMVNYDHDKNDTRICLCGTFFMLKKELFNKIKFDDNSIQYNGHKNKNVPFSELKKTEDVDFSKTIYKEGFVIDFDKNNFVWHANDGFYHLNRLHDSINHDVIILKDNILNEKGIIVENNALQDELKKTVYNLTKENIKNYKDYFNEEYFTFLNSSLGDLENKLYQADPMKYLLGKYRH
jgi:hypothetical protein